MEPPSVLSRETEAIARKVKEEGGKKGMQHASTRHEYLTEYTISIRIHGQSTLQVSIIQAT